MLCTLDVTWDGIYHNFTDLLLACCPDDHQPEGLPGRGRQQPQHHLQQPHCHHGSWTDHYFYNFTSFNSFILVYGIQFVIHSCHLFNSYVLLWNQCVGLVLPQCYPTLGAFSFTFQILSFIIFYCGKKISFLEKGESVVGSRSSISKYQF